jgi:hypothetical protein
VDEVRVDDTAVNEWVRDPGGPLARMLSDLAGKVAGIARSVVRRRSGNTYGRDIPGTGAAPGSTLASIGTALHTGGTVPWAEASADMVGVFLERGTRPHAIRSHGPWSLENTESGYFGRVVAHPGTRPYPFLTAGLWSVPLE